MFTFSEGALSFDSAGLRARGCEQNVNIKKEQHIEVFTENTHSLALAKVFRQNPRRHLPDWPLRRGEPMQIIFPVVFVRLQLRVPAEMSAGAIPFFYRVLNTRE